MKRIRVGKYLIEQSTIGYGYHLYKDSEVSVKVDHKVTGETKTVTKTVGYDMPLKAVLKVISEDQSFKESDTINDLLKRIEIKLETVTNIILNQIRCEQSKSTKESFLTSTELMSILKSSQKKKEMDT